MKSIIARHAVHLILVSALGLSVTGCATYAMNDVLRGPSSTTHRYGIDQDVRRYVSNVDRRVRINRRQEQRMFQLLRDRTYRLLDRTRSSDHRHVYPFPRRDYRRMNSVQRNFWRDVDRRIERTLTRSQARRYERVFGRDNVRVRSRYERSNPRRSSRVYRRDDRDDDRGWRSGRRSERDDDRDRRSRDEGDEHRDRSSRSRNERDDNRVSQEQERDADGRERRRSSGRGDD